MTAVIGWKVPAVNGQNGWIGNHWYCPECGITTVGPAIAEYAAHYAACPNYAGAPAEGETHDG